MLRIHFFQPNSQIRVLIWIFFVYFQSLAIAYVAASSLNCVCIHLLYSLQQMLGRKTPYCDMAGVISVHSNNLLLFHCFFWCGNLIATVAALLVAKCRYEVLKFLISKSDVFFRCILIILFFKSYFYFFFAISFFLPSLELLLSFFRLFAT